MLYKVFWTFPVPRVPAASKQYLSLVLCCAAIQVFTANALVCTLHKLWRNKQNPEVHTEYMVSWARNSVKSKPKLRHFIVMAISMPNFNTQVSATHAELFKRRQRKVFLEGKNSFPPSSNTLMKSFHSNFQKNSPLRRVQGPYLNTLKTFCKD